MFHGFQMSRKEKRWPNEMVEGLSYKYITKNLSIKYIENKLLDKLIDNFTKDKFNEFLTLRKYREKKFSKEFSYETKIEVIEGMAEYVELKALKCLNEKLFIEKISNTKKLICDFKNLIPIRMISYKIGALLLLICDQNKISFYHEIGSTSKTIFEILSTKIDCQDLSIENNTKIELMINNYYERIKQDIELFIDSSTSSIIGTFEIYGLDPLNTIKYNNYIHCKHFLAYKDKEEVKYINQECIASINDDFMINKICT